MIKIIIIIIIMIIIIIIIVIISGLKSCIRLVLFCQLGGKRVPHEYKPNYITIFSFNQVIFSRWLNRESSNIHTTGYLYLWGN